MMCVCVITMCPCSMLVLFRCHACVSASVFLRIKACIASPSHSLSDTIYLNWSHAIDVVLLAAPCTQTIALLPHHTSSVSSFHIIPDQLSLSLYSLYTTQDTEHGSHIGGTAIR